MLTSFLALLGVTTQVASLVVPRDDSGPPNPGSPTVTGQGLQDVPDGGKAPNTFNNGQPQMNGGFPYSSDPIPDIYQPRDIDIPFGWMFHGNISLFPAGQLNDPSMNTDNWTPNQYDNPDQSACGIPDNAYFQAKAAIHPYFLKYAGLDREFYPLRQHARSVHADRSFFVTKAIACKTCASRFGPRMMDRI